MISITALALPPVDPLDRRPERLGFRNVEYLDGSSAGPRYQCDAVCIPLSALNGDNVAAPSTTRIQPRSTVRESLKRATRTIEKGPQAAPSSN